MKRLREKWNSRSGASILLALLFLLVCVMVAASVLMAAVSNAGKIRSNYEEQQKYMALSSALRLVAGQLEAATYTGQYTVTTWTEKIQVGVDEDGNPIMQDQPYFKVEQIEGDFQCGALGDTLSFADEMDNFFGERFTGDGFYPLGPSAVPDKRALEVTVEGFEDQNLFPKVTVEARMISTTRRIVLDAVMVDPTADPSTNKKYTMRAELIPEGVPVLDYNPGSALPKETPASGAKDVKKSDIQKAEPKVKWKLDWIGREVAGG